MKVKYRDFKEQESITYTSQRFYENKYFGLFLNAYKFDNLTRSQRRYLLKKLWQNGTCCCFVLAGTKQEPSMKSLLTNKTKDTIAIGNESPNGLLIFTPYAPIQYNIEDEPSVVNIVNIREAQFLPTSPQVVNKDVVICWAHSSHAPIRSLVMYYIEKIVDVENTINMNLFVHKLPRLVVCSPEDKARVEDLMEAIERGEKKLFLDANDVQAIKNVLESGSNTSYIIDKLYQYKQSLENELLTFLGINNVSIEKKERLITDEANSNNQLINDCSECFLDSLREFCENVSNILDYPLSVEATSSPDSNEELGEEEYNEDEGEEDNA